MKHIITKETMKYLEEVKPKHFYSYALFKNIFGDDDIPYDSFRKVLVRREKEGEKPNSDENSSDINSKKVKNLFDLL